MRLAPVLMMLCVGLGLGAIPVRLLAAEPTPLVIETTTRAGAELMTLGSKTLTNVCLVGGLTESMVATATSLGWPGFTVQPHGPEYSQVVASQLQIVRGQAVLAIFKETFHVGAHDVEWTQCNTSYNDLNDAGYLEIAAEIALKASEMRPTGPRSWVFRIKDGQRTELPATDKTPSELAAQMAGRPGEKLLTVEYIEQGPAGAVIVGLYERINP